MDVGVVEICDDVVGNRMGANSFSLFKSTRFFPYLDGTNGAWGFTRYPVGIHSTYLPDPEIAFPYQTLSEMEALSVEVRAKTNPSRSSVNVPAFIGELKDLPQLVKGWGRGLMKDVAQANLSWRFGLAPMISDIRKMTKFMKLSNERFNELRKLRDKKALRKRLSLPYEKVVHDPTNIIIHSQGAFITGTRQDEFTSKSWATIEWKLDPSSDIPKQTDQELLKLANRLVTGLTSFGAVETAWELMPWSWLADWFGNVGDFIAAHNNTVPCTWGRICYMRTTKGSSVILADPASIPSGVTLSGQFRLWVERKIRQPVVPISPIPLPFLPILNGGQLSILASLAALRR
jgi:hypothetical protein